MESEKKENGNTYVGDMSMMRWRPLAPPHQISAALVSKGQQRLNKANTIEANGGLQVGARPGAGLRFHVPPQNGLPPLW